MRNDKHNGPISLLLATCHDFGSVMDKNCIIHTKDELPIDILMLPYQMLGPMVKEVVANARTKAADPRTIHMGLEEIDKSVWRAALKYLPNENDKRFQQAIAAGCNWTQAAKNHIDDTVEQECPLCETCYFS